VDFLLVDFLLLAKVILVAEILNLGHFLPQIKILPVHQVKAVALEVERKAVTAEAAIEAHGSLFQFF
jgi:hypothetical protein